MNKRNIGSEIAIGVRNESTRSMTQCQLTPRTRLIWSVLNNLYDTGYIAVCLPFNTFYCGNNEAYYFGTAQHFCVKIQSPVSQ